MFVYKCKYMKNNKTKTKYGKANDVKTIINEFGDYCILEMKISKEKGENECRN